MVGGRLMDTFMDKLAQKLTAQDMIKANSAAEAEEYARLQNQVKEYHKCLEQMNQVSKEMRQMNNKMNIMLTRTGEEMLKMCDKMGTMLTGTSEEMLKTYDQISTMLTGAVEDDLKKVTCECLAKIDEIRKEEDISQELITILNERFQAADEYAHRENVKVYRNVQAVVVDESSRQQSAFQNELGSVKKKQGVIFTFSLLAMILSAIGVLFQLLVYLQVL